MSDISKISGAVIVSWSFMPGEPGLLLVGNQNNGQIDVINSFTGTEAQELFNKLTTKKEEK